MFSILERSFLALDWDPDLKKRYFDENAAEVSHHSSHIFPMLITILLHSFASTRCILLVEKWLCTRKALLVYKHAFF